MKKIGIKMIDIYKMFFSPIFEYMGVTCKYYPTCSEYARQAITERGFLQGSYLSVKRVLKCNPFSKGGYDPVK